jgi:hypothetical protein
MEEKVMKINFEGRYVDTNTIKCVGWCMYIPPEWYFQMPCYINVNNPDKRLADFCKIVDKKVWLVKCNSHEGAENLFVCVYTRRNFNRCQVKKNLKARGRKMDCAKCAFTECPQTSHFEVILKIFAESEAFQCEGEEIERNDGQWSTQRDFIDEMTIYQGE